MAAPLWVDTAHPANAGVLRSIRRNRLKAALIAAPESVIDPYYDCGSRPEVVEWVWDQLGPALPVDSRCLLYGTPALVHPRNGVILAVSYGTQYVLRIPVDALGEALKAGAQTTIRAWWGEIVTDIQHDFGPDWIFGQCLVQELQWCRTVYEAMDRPTDQDLRDAELDGLGILSSALGQKVCDRSVGARSRSTAHAMAFLLLALILLGLSLSLPGRHVAGDWVIPTLLSLLAIVVALGTLVVARMPEGWVKKRLTGIIDGLERAYVFGGLLGIVFGAAGCPDHFLSIVCFQHICVYALIGIALWKLVSMTMRLLAPPT